MILEKKLIEACKNGEALCYAASNGHLETVKYLIEQGADIHVKNNGALLCAMEQCHFEVIKFLMKSGADIHVNDDEALRWAIINGNLDIVKFLAEKGADIHASNDGALRWAVIKNNLDIVNYLFSLYENKEDAFKIILKNLFFIKNDISVIKNIIDNYDLNLDKEALETMQEKHPDIYDYLRISKETQLIKNNMDFII